MKRSALPRFFRRARPAAALPLLAALGLAACGGGTTSTSSSSSSGASSSAPGAPTGVVLSAGDGRVTVAFSAPAGAGSTAITQYTASCASGTSGGSATATGTASPLTVTGLVNGVTYACGVTATNATGSGPSSTPATITATGLASVLTIDVNALDNYARPALPAYYDARVLGTDNTPASNPVTDRGATLGRVLFHDTRLSVTGTVACATCHQAGAGFSDPDRFSTGVTGAAGTAHAPRLGNVRYWQPGTMFWDQRAASLELQASQPIINPIEMGFDATHGGIAALLPALQAQPEYQELFRFAFGDPTVTEARVQDALAQFERAMVSTGSTWDAGFALVYDPTLPDQGRSLPVPTLTAQEDRGRALFMGGPGVGVGCAGCHVPPTFALNADSKSNGLDAGQTTIFKSPSLKNAGVAGAFMHDGRFATLAEVVDFYDHGVQAGPALDPRLVAPNGLPRQLRLSAADKAALVAFMQSLTDTTLIDDPKFSSPFRP